MPLCIYEYVFPQPTVQYIGRFFKARGTDGTVQKISTEEGTQSRRRVGTSWDTYAYFTSKSQKITRRKSLNDLQGMLKISK